LISFFYIKRERERERDGRSTINLGVKIPPRKAAGEGSKAVETPPSLAEGNAMPAGAFLMVKS
jgi:hypothetical protein